MISETNSECKKKMKYSFNQICIPLKPNDEKDEKKERDEKISYSISLVWSQDWKQRDIFNGQIPYTQSRQMAERDILDDLKTRGLKFRTGRKIIVRLVSRKTIKKQSQKKLYIFEGVIIENKINLPQGYSYLPNQFDGFIIQGLSIANQFGCITWVGSVNIEGIDFRNGIKIEPDSIQCNHNQLLKDVIVEFYKLPAYIEQKLCLTDKKMVLEKLKKKVQKMSSSKFLKYEQINKHWYVLLRMGDMVK